MQQLVSSTNTDMEMFMMKLRKLVHENDNNTPIGNNPYIEAKKPEIELLYEDLAYVIGYCFKDMIIDAHEVEDVGIWKTRLIEAAQQAEDIIDMFVSSAIIKNDYDLHIMDRSFGYRYDLIDCTLKGLKDVMDEIKCIRQEIMCNKNLVNKIEDTGTACSSGITRVNFNATEHEELIVGFDEDALLIMDRLTGHRKKLDITSIVGMCGLGKTTLATKIFNDSLVDYHFDMRGWATVSQAYSERDMLLQLLVSIGKLVDEAKSEYIMREMLYQSLKCRRYLIVIDDIWSSKAWDDVVICFPDDNNGSRVLVTTRLTEVALHASQGGFTHNLGPLNADQSWELLCRKTFRECECPESLTETGKRIAKKCGGLPLAIVVIAGLLEKGEKRKDLWEKIVERVGSYVINDPKGCLDTLALSYDHLPCHLKKCFLYVGAFPEGYKIQVRRLIRLWMAEGFIKKTGRRSLEEDAEGYLRGLIDRNLLIVVDRSSSGGVKSCRLHDLLRQLCLKKASEENIFTRKSMPMSNNNLFSDSVSSIVKQRRLFTDHKVLCEIYLHGFATHTRSVLGFNERKPSVPYTTTRWIHSYFHGFDTHTHSLFWALMKGNRQFLIQLEGGFIPIFMVLPHTRGLFWALMKGDRQFLILQGGVHSFLLLRVLDLLNIPLVEFGNIGMLIHLWYLAVWSNRAPFSLSEVNLCSLQTLIVKGKFQSFIYIPDNMVNLRHLRCDRITIPTDFSVPTLFNLQTISRLILDHRTKLFLESFPDIKKLGCSVSPASSNRGLLSFAMLTHLEALKIDQCMHWSLNLTKPIRFPIRFPETLRKLTLKRLYLPWNHMSTIQQLPKLEVLKLLDSSFCGHLWETGDEQFHQLKFLKLEKLNICLWEASSINFPRLRKLVVKGCGCLTEIPLELGNIYTLEHIETDYSNPQVHESVNRIQEAQHEMGNCDIHVNFTHMQGSSNSS